MLAGLPEDVPLIVWCGNGQLSKRGTDDGWLPMGALLRELTGVEPFAIDQITTVQLSER